MTEKTFEADSNTNCIEAFHHCALCLKSKPDDQSPAEWSDIQSGWTKWGFQVWCKRHDCNILHVDFEGVKHPGDHTRLAMPDEIKKAH